MVSVLDYDENTFVQSLHTWDVIWIGMKQRNDSITDDMSDFEWTDGSTLNSVSFNYFTEQGDYCYPSNKDLKIKHYLEYLINKLII